MPHGADEEQQADRRGDRRRTPPGARWPAAKTFAEIGGAEGVEDQEDAEDEAEVADAVDDERFLAGVGGEVLVVVEADQQVRAEPDSFPSDEHHHVVRSEHEQQHHEHEEIEVGEEARVALLVRHVAGGVDVDQEADPRDDQQHRAGERIDAEREVDGEVGERARR